MAEREDLLWLIGHRPKLSEVSWIPAADIYRTPNGWLVKLELAGVRVEDIEITLSSHQLRVSGVRRDSEWSEGLECYQMEMTYSRFERILTFPCELNPRRIETESVNGLLIVRLICD